MMNTQAMGKKSRIPVIVMFFAFFLILPYLFAIIALVLVYRRAESPQSLMKPYDREQR